MKTKRERHPAVDVLRVLAIMAVVAIHTSTRTLEHVNGVIDALPFSFLVNQISRFAVPLFFMISGYVLELTYPFHQNYFVYLKKRFNKIFLPYVVWSGFYYLIVYKVHSVNFLQALIGGNASYQLYFIPTLLIFYIIFPLLHELYRFLSYRISLISLVILQVALLFRDYYIHPLPIFYPIDIALLNYMFFILGMVAARNQTKIMSWVAKHRTLLVWIVIASGLYMTEEARGLYLATKNYLDYYSSWRPSIFVYTISFALLFYYIFEKSKRFTSLSHKLSELSFFVFFIHVAILEVVWNFVGQSFFDTLQNSFEKAFYLVGFFGVVTLISYSAAFVVHRLPFVSKLTG